MNTNEVTLTLSLTEASLVLSALRDAADRINAPQLDAVIDNLKSIHFPTSANKWFSAAVCSDGSYGVEPGLISSFPLTTDGKSWKIVQGIQHNDFAREKITATVNELREERTAIADLLKA